MTAIQVAFEAAKHGAQLFRQRKDGSGEYDCKPIFTGRSSGWVILDSFSGSVIIAVHGALNQTNREKFEKLPLLKMAPIAFKLAK